MAKKDNKTKQSNVIGKIAAIQTLLERYPTLTTTDPLLTNFSLNTSLGFMLSLLELFGVTQAQIIRWLCKILGTSEKGDCILTIIEFAIKGILLANVKEVFTCSINPTIPDILMKYVVQNGRPDPCSIVTTDPAESDGIEIDIASVDMFGLLNNCPSDYNGGVFYFDAADPIILQTHEESGRTIVDSYQPHYMPKDLWKSKDFNAFLWYVINKGSLGSQDQILRNTWDDRLKASKTYENIPSLKEAYFNDTVPPPASTPIITVTDAEGKNSVEKRQILIAKYVEHEDTSQHTNIIKFWINADRYYKTRHLKLSKKKPRGIDLNKTIFEFNYDYIYSLKLFDTKTLLANITNSLLGLSASLSMSLSFEMQVIAEQVKKMVKKVIQASDTEIDDCYFTFSDSEYETMLNETTKAYNGRYTGNDATYNPKFDDTFSALRNLNSVSDKEVDQIGVITNAITTVESAYAEDKGLSRNFNFTFSYSFLEDFIYQTVTQIVLSVLTPKVAILYAINSKVMGGDAMDLNGWSDFLQKFPNLMVTIIKQVKDIILQELYKFLMETMKPIIQLLISKLLLETIKYYKDIISDLLYNCVPMININLNGASTIIDNVQYADIVPAEQKSEGKTC